MAEVRHKTGITPMEWSFVSEGVLRFRGPNVLAAAGRWTLVELHVEALPHEQRYALARTLSRWCERAERQAIADMEAEAQQPLFDLE